MTARTDPHAHLDMVAARLGPLALADLFAAYGASSGAEAPFMVDIGVEPGDLTGRVARYGALPFVRFAAGLWPGHAALADPDRSLGMLARDLENPACVALGECGLDYHHMDAPPEAQIALFRAQVEMAIAAGLPLVVHSRDAARDTMDALGNACAAIPVAIHCFGYGPAEAAAFLGMGCHLSFAGNLTYGKSAPLREALAIVPQDRLLFETDAPYMNPEPRRGRASTPLDLERTIAFAAALRGQDPEELSRIAHRNAAAIFSAGRSGATRFPP